MRMTRSAKRCGVIVLGLTVLAGASWREAALCQGPTPAGEGGITKGNLFSPTRGPWVPPPPPAKPEPPPAKPEPPPPPPQFVLYGVMIMGDERRALLKEPKLTGGKVEQLSLGAQVGPYKLTGIEADRVILEKDGTSLTVTVEDPARPKGQVIAIPTPAPQPASVQPAAPSQPGASQPQQPPSPVQTLSDALSKFSQRLRSQPPAQPGQQAPGQPGQ